MLRSHSFISNNNGWELELERFTRASGPDPERRPILIVPGYAMNAFILSFHPSGQSMVEYLVDDGFEVWTCNLRGQGGARRNGPARRFGLAELALEDLPVALDHVLANTTSRRQRVDAIGCSLGASLVYAYLAHHADDHVLGAAISVGGPLRWDEVHPAFRVAFRSGRIAGSIPIRGTRRLARLALPLVRRVPALLSIYMNAGQVDLTAADQLVNTVDNPVPYINRQIARWIRDRDLVIRGLNITEALGPVKLPVLCVLANADGIVPVEAVLSAQRAMPDASVDVLRVGDETNWYAHADLFIAHGARDRVFEPMRAWLTHQSIRVVA